MSVRTWLLALALCGLLAPTALAKRPKKAEEPAPEPQTEQAATEAVPQAEAPAATKTLVGHWKIVLDEQQQKDLSVLQLAFREPPPTEDELAGLSTEEATMVAMILMAREADPNSKELADMRAMMEGMGNATLAFTPDKMTMNLGGMELVGTYAVTSTEGDTWKVHHVPAEGDETDFQVTFDGANAILLGNGEGGTTRFERQ